MAAFKCCDRQPALGDSIEMSQHRHINVETLVDEALLEMERSGGPGASAAIKSFVPTWQSADEELHRGFR